MTAPGVRVPTSTDWLGHPRALTFLFLTGMWEVAALAGMRAVLVFHLARDLGLPVAVAVQVFGLSTAASFVMSFAGGAAADRVLGVGRAVVIGALLMAAGHVALISDRLLYPGLAVIALGSGLFRPTLIADVWRLYADGDPRTNDALLRYKLGCNLGGILGPLVCGALFEYVGWISAMLFAGGGMLVAAAVYLASGSTRAGSPRPIRRVTAEPRQGRRFAPSLTAGMLLVLLGGSLHWTAANQQGGALAVFTLDQVIRTVQVMGRSFVIPAGWFQTVNPTLTLLLAPLLSWRWARRPARDPAAAEVRRMVAGSVLLAVAFLILAAAVAAARGAPVHWIWLVLSTAPLTLGELYIDTAGQAYFCRHAPRGYLSTFLSLWLVTSTLGYVAAAWLAGLWSSLRTDSFFVVSAAVALVSAFSLILIPFTSRRSKDA